MVGSAVKVAVVCPLSHDLKTPLVNIMTFTNLLEGRLKSSKDASVHKFLSFIKEGGERLNHLISDTLEYSKISNKEYEWKDEVIDLNVLLAEIENSIAIYLKEQNATIIKQVSLPSINAPHAYLVPLFKNLIENGIKYNQSEKPTITIRMDEGAKFFSIFIEDNGIGIAEEFQDKVFVMYSRLHNHNEYSGSGLGLSTCKKILNLLNGEIHLQSKVDKGSIFEIKFPKNLLIH